MAFLNNSGDIILDAVLTDLGRLRLAQGDGTFKITQFALGDDEIDYSQYNLTTGSAYQDLDILQTPILEAITDNVSSMKSKLVTYSRTDLLYLPVTKLNYSNIGGAGFNTSSLGVYIALVNPENDFINGGVTNTIYGLQQRGTAQVLAPGNFYSRASGDRSSRTMTVQQGLDTTQVSFTNPLDTTLTETDYFVYLDNRLGSLVDAKSNPKQPVYVDDDNIATYLISQKDIDSWIAVPNPDEKGSNPTSPAAIAGPYNRQALRLSIYASDDLAYSDFLFDKFGNTADTAASAGGSSYGSVYSIDTQLRVVGAKTGYSMSIPIRFVKIKTF
jgi:hypothetical protein